ncbi:MAG: group III truncated hemoglobin [Cellulophaga sp.]
MAKEIENIEDIKFLVDTFYGKIREDALLGDIFNTVIKDKWAVHLEKMYSFWQTLLLEEHTYNGSPFPPHVHLPVGKEHFDQWIVLFTKTIDENFIGEKAEEAKWRAGKMAEMFQYKIEYFKNRGTKPLT